MTIDNISAASRQSTTIIVRDGASLWGLRHVTDDACVVGVHAFPFAEIPSVVAGGAFARPGAYLLVNNSERLAYPGESGNIGQRLQKHALDPAKGFADEVYVLSSFEGRLDKSAVLHLEMRISEAVERNGVYRLVNANGPCTPELAEWRKVSLDRVFEQSLPLFFDAGCRAFTPLAAAPAEGCGVAAATTLVPDTPEPPVTADEPDEGPMEIGVTTVPVGVEELSLSFADLWARGYEHQGRFVVAAGSEMRKVANPSASANEHTITRRQRLIDTNTVTLVDGVSDRYRLQVAVAFPSRAIAAKVLCGAHVGSEKWRPFCAVRPYVIAA